MCTVIRTDGTASGATQHGHCGCASTRAIEEANSAVVHRLHDLINEGDLDALDALFTPDFTGHDTSRRPSAVEDLRTVEDLKTVIRGAREQFDEHHVVQDLIASGDRVVVRLDTTGRHRAEAFGTAPTGRPTTMRTIGIYRLTGGLIAERWVVSDVAGLMTQLDVALPG